MSNRRRTPLKIVKNEVHSCTPILRLNILHNLPFFNNLSHQEVTEINKIFNDIGYVSEETIYHMADRSTRLCVIASGSVKLIRQNADGKEVLMDILKQGEFFGSLDPFGDTYYQETAIALQPSCILKIDSEEFRTILQKYPVVSLQVLDTTAKRLLEAQERIKQLSAHSVENRIAYTLLKLGQKLGEQNENGILIQIPLSRYDIAGMAGTTPETASRIISKFKNADILKTGRKWTIIKNIEQLEKMVKII